MHTAKHKYANTRSSENNNTLSHWVGGRWQDGIRIKGPASRLTDGFGFIEGDLQWFSFTRLYVASSNCTDWHRKWGNKSCRDYLFIDEVTLLWCCRPLHDHCTGHLLQCQPLAGGPKTWDGWQWKQKQNREQNTGKAQRSGDINVYGFFDVCRGRLWIFITGIPLQQDILCYDSGAAESYNPGCVSVSLPLIWPSTRVTVWGNTNLLNTGFPAFFFLLFCVVFFLRFLALFLVQSLLTPALPGEMNSPYPRKIKTSIGCCDNVIASTLADEVNGS